MPIGNEIGNELGNDLVIAAQPSILPSLSVAATNLAIFDKLAASYLVSDLTAMAASFAQLPLLIRGGDGITSTAYGFGADKPILTLLPAADSLIAQSVPNVILAGIYRVFLAALATSASQMGFSSLDTYLTAQNAAAPLSYLVPPSFALLWSLYNNQQGNLLLSAGNVFAPQTQLGLGAIGASAGSVVFTAQSSIPAANVVLPGIGASTQGYTAAPGASAQVTTAINGTLTLTLTATGQTAAGAFVTGRRWTAVLDNLAAGAAAVFTPAVAGDRIASAVACTGAGSATAGAFTLMSMLERVVR